VRIVETEQDEFLSVASKLDDFKDMLTDLKESAVDFHEIFCKEKTKTE